MSLPKSTRGFDAIFTIVDRFSRLVRFIPCKSNITAHETAQLFFEHWICRFGTPSKIISDRDPRFQSAFWKSLCAAFDSRLAMSTSYHPQTDGLTERFHRSVEQILRCYASYEQSSWCLLLSQCEFALNATVQDSHGAIPFEVVYGCVPAMPLDLALPLQSQSASDIIQHRADVRTRVHSLQDASSRRMAAQADRRRQESDFAVGQDVWLSTANLPLRTGTRKLAARWTGPYRIAERVTREAWRLQLPASLRIHNVFYSSQLKAVEGLPRQRAPVLLEDESEEYEVAAVLGRRLVRGQEQFLVRWKGYSSFDDTWEPRANLANAQEALKKFLEKQQ